MKNNKRLVIIETECTPKGEVKGWKKGRQKCYIHEINGRLAIYPVFADIYNPNAKSPYFVFDTKEDLEEKFEVHSWVHQNPGINQPLDLVANSLT